MPRKTLDKRKECVRLSRQRQQKSPHGALGLALLSLINALRRGSRQEYRGINSRFLIIRSLLSVFFRLSGIGNNLRLQVLQQFCRNKYPRVFTRGYLFVSSILIQLVFFVFYFLIPFLTAFAMALLSIILLNMLIRLYQ